MGDWKGRPTHSFRVDHETHAMLATLAREQGIAQAKLLAQLVREAYAAAFPEGEAPASPRSPRPSKWTPEAVIAAIQERQAAGLEVTPYRTQLEAAGLWEGGCRVFGSWADALEAAGIELPPKRIGQMLLGLRRVRQRCNMSQQALSEAINLSQSVLSHLERGTRPPTPATVRAIARALRCEPEELRRP